MVWIATEKTGIWSYNASADRFRHYEHSNNVMSYYTDTLARVETKGDRTWFKMKSYGLPFIIIVTAKEIADGLLLHAKFAGYTFYAACRKRSAPAAVAARDIDGTREASPVAWLGSIITGR